MSRVLVKSAWGSDDPTTPWALRWLGILVMLDVS